MSEQQESSTSSPKPKVGSLRDRIAAFEKSAQSDNTPVHKPLPSRVAKPGNVSWKPTPSQPPVDDAGDEKAGGEKKHGHGGGGMSADDAKESIAAGGSLKARMAAWQGNVHPSGGSPAGGPAPPPGPKPLRKPFVPRPPTPDENDNEGSGNSSKQKESLPIPHRRLDGWDPLAAISAAAAATGTRQRSPSPPGPAQDEHTGGETTAIGTAAGEEQQNQEGGDDDEDELAKERERRAALAARMARLGGARIGMAPPIIPKKPKPSVSADEEPTVAARYAGQPQAAPIRVLPLPGRSASVETPLEVKETGSDTLRTITVDDEMTSRAAPTFSSVETPETPEEHTATDTAAEEASSSQTSLVSSRSATSGSIPLPAMPRRALPPPRSKHSARSLKSDQSNQESDEHPVVVETAATQDVSTPEEVSETLQGLSVTSPPVDAVYDEHEEEHHEVEEESADHKDDQAEEDESHHAYDDEGTVQGAEQHVDDVGNVEGDDDEVEKIEEEYGVIETEELKEEEAGYTEEAEEDLHDDDDDDIPVDEDELPPPPPPPRRQQSSQSGVSSSLHDDIPVDEEEVSPPSPPPPPPRRQQSSQSGTGSSKESVNSPSTTKGGKEFFQVAAEELEES